MIRTILPGLVTLLPLAAVQLTPGVQIISPLSFGGLLVQPGGGQVTLTAAGSLLPEGPGVFPGAKPMASYGRILVSGPANAPYRLRIGPPTVILRGSGGGSLTLVSFLAPAPVMAGRLDGAGLAEIQLGGTLGIPRATPAGTYSGVAMVQLFIAGFQPVYQPLTVLASVRSPLTLTTLDHLDFGCITPGGGGSFTVDAGGHRAGESGPRLVKGAPHAAAFLLTGTAQTPYTLILPTEITLAGPGAPMTVAGFNCDLGRQGVLSGAGLVFHVGAELRVAVNQAPGVYRGIVLVTVAYP
jgi:hypothetical protein